MTHEAAVHKSRLARHHQVSDTLELGTILHLLGKYVHRIAPSRDMNYVDEILCDVLVDKLP